MSISEAYQVECVGDKAKGEIIVMVWTCIDERQWIYWTKDVEDRAASRKKRGMYGLLYCRRTFRGLMWQRMLSGIKINKQTNITTTKKHHWFYTVQFSKSQIFGHVCWMTVYISISIVISVTLCEYKVFSVFLAIWLKKKKRWVLGTGTAHPVEKTTHLLKCRWRVPRWSFWHVFYSLSCALSNRNMFFM